MYCGEMYDWIYHNVDVQKKKNPENSRRVLTPILNQTLGVLCCTMY